MRKLLFFGLVLLGLQGSSQTFSGTGGLVSDDGMVNNFTLTVTGLSPAALDNTHGLIGVCFSMAHTYVSDMDITLVSPDGTQFKLVSGVGGGDDDFTNTCFSQSSGTPIVSGTAPFTGTFKPMGYMGNVNSGQNGNGVWTLRCVDTYPADQGNLLSWSITFGPSAAVPIMTESNLPLVLINTYGNTIVNDPKINAELKIIDNGYGNINHVSDAPAFTGEIGIEIRGAFSASLPQKPYGFETRDALGNNLDTVLLGMPAENDWVLIALYGDKAFVRNALAYKLFNEMGHYASRVRFCEVILNGEYQGIYYLGESIKRDNERVDIAKLEPTETSGLDVTGGYIIKNDYWNSSNSFLSNYHPIDHPSFDVHLVYHYPKPDEIVPAQQAYIAGFIDDYESALYGSNFSDTTNGYRAYADVFSFIDYFIVNELARNNDGFKKSSYFHKEKDKSTGIGKLYAGPVWDFDWAWKNIDECSIFSATDGSGWAHHINDCGPDVNSPGWYVRMLQDTGFQNILRCRWERFRTNILDTAYLFNYIDTTCYNYLYQAQQRHYDTWGHLGLNSGAPEVGPIPTTYTGEVEAFKTWIRKRLTWLDDNIPGTAVNCTFTGLAETGAEPMVRVFPNPCSQYLFVEGNLPEKTRLRLVHQSGAVIMDRSIKGSATQVMDVSQLASGLYLLQLQGSDGKTVHRRIAITH